MAKVVEERDKRMKETQGEGQFVDRSNDPVHILKEIFGRKKVERRALDPNPIMNRYK